MTSVLGYCDPISAAPGDTVRFMVSCISADEYTVDMVRLTGPQSFPEASPFQPEPVDAPANGRHLGREQPLRPGSYAVIGPHRRLIGLESFTVQAYVWPTTPGRGHQALVGSWSERDRAGFGLALDERGALMLRIGDGAGRVESVSTGVPLAERRWYLVAGSYDSATSTLAVRQVPVDDGTFHLEDGVHRERHAPIRVAPGPGTVLLAAWQDGPAPGAGDAPIAGAHFNGKIDRPRLADRALAPAEISALAGDGPLAPGLGASLVARWDLAREIPTETIVDTSPNRVQGRTINLPARAMTGHNWTGKCMDWTRAPAQYGAIHFHDDDLVDAGWEPDFAFEVPPDLRSGVYAARLSAGAAEFWVVFFVRPPRGETRAPIAFLASTATYTVYMNNRGRFLTQATELYHGRLTVMDAIDELNLKFPGIGVSTYDRHSDGSGVCYSSRHRPATNVRPTGRHWNFNLDLFIVDWLEHLGVDYDVITEEDLHQEGLALLEQYRVVLTGSHPEYDSAEMLDALEGYLRGGGRLMYMGGNGFYWRIAHHPTRRGVLEVRRAEGGVRAWDAEPGEYYHSFTGEYGGLWRRQGRAPQRLAGVGFISQGFDACSYYRRAKASRDTRVAFMFEGIDEEILGDFGVLQGGAAGLEIDCVDPALGTPPYALRVASSENHSNTYELVAEEVRVPHGATNAAQNEGIRADLVFFETPGGGAVFSTGSIAYAGSLSWNRFDNNIARLSTNVLRRFADPAPFELPTGNGTGDRGAG
jgi:N,N-dimethylformamidase